MKAVNLLPTDLRSGPKGAAPAVSAGTEDAGGPATGIRGALDVPAIELQGCTNGQTDVARLMSRLRDVDRVTRVSLAKSDKETATPRPPVAQTATAATASTSTGADVTACGKG